jgi:predicted AAA+ superfamily ATPase
MEYIRKLNLLELLGKKSFFLFGPRSTGKSFLIKKQLLGKAIILDLLNSELFLRLSAMPSTMKELIDSQREKYQIVVIDEIQRIPELLSEVHRLIEDQAGIKFLLTGSSARKLKRNPDIDMLAGRAWTANLFPLTWSEIGNFELDRYLRFGGLPQVYPSAEPQEELYAYVENYLKEEIVAEGLIRKLPPFARFLKSAAFSNGSPLNFSEIANDCQVPPSTIREYYSILQDTLMGYMLEPWIGSKKRKAVQTAKFYFFDTGVTHTLAGTVALDRNSNLYGSSFEQFIIMEVKAYLSYKRIKESISFWRSLNGQEVDILIGEKTAIEVKSTGRVSPRDFKGLVALSEEGIFKNFYLVSQDNISIKRDMVMAIHWEDFLKRLWNGEIWNPSP